MVTLYCRQNCPRCTSLAEELQSLAIRSQTVTVPAGASLPRELPKCVHLPVLVDDGELYQGAEAVLERISQLEELRQLWYRFQSDVCYCDESNTTTEAD